MGHNSLRSGFISAKFFYDKAIKEDWKMQRQDRYSLFQLHLLFFLLQCNFCLLAALLRIASIVGFMFTFYLRESSLSR